ncbi:MAG: phage virion morphogenesis protein [Bacteroidales bacterium]|nr:phage virion morphogenesis protein [Bacteroidales bacterium]
MKSKQFLQKLINDLRVELLDEFDRNFERKGFFNKPWPARKIGRKGSLLTVRGGGGLRGSLKATANQNSVTFTSSLPYAAIHNEGGTITVTAKMKRFFWAKYYEAGGKVKQKKSGGITKSSARYSEEAEFYKNLALMKVGSKITMPERRFIGHAPEVDEAVNRVVKKNFKDVENYIKSLLIQPKK